MSWRRGQAHGQDLRDRVLAPSDAPVRTVAARFGVSASYVVKARARQRASGQTTGRSTIKNWSVGFQTKTVRHDCPRQPSRAASLVDGKNLR
jgi:hypothetical protein